MNNKLLNLFIQDRKFQLKAAAILVIAIALIFLFKQAQAQERKAAKLRQEVAQANQLLQDKPILEARLKALHNAKSRDLAQPKPGSEPNFKGVFIQDNGPVALIGDQLYKENDSVGRFTIKKITPEYIIVEDNDTLQQATLSLPE